jgi:serine/threonine-protein kinase
VSDYDEPPRRSSTGRTALITAVVLLVLAGLAFGAFRLLSNRGNDQVSVPSLIGVSAGEADSQLREANLVASVVSVQGPKDTMNTVLNQDPPAGTQVAAGSTVTLEINVGPADAKVPKNLLGEDVDDAKAVLKKAGFTSVKTKKAADPPADAKQGEVVKVDPDENASVALGETITLTYVGDDEEKTTPPATATAEATKAADEPTKSSEPTTSATEEPTKSSEPTKSTEPTKSSEPTTSTAPTQSTQSTKPRRPKPPKPSKSAKAVEPAQDVPSASVQQP